MVTTMISEQEQSLTNTKNDNFITSTDTNNNNNSNGSEELVPQYTLNNVQDLDHLWISVLPPLYKEEVVKKKTSTELYMEYNPEKLIDFIVSSCKCIAKHLGINFKHFYIDKENDCIKHNTTYCILCVHFSNLVTQKNNIEMRFEIPILTRLSNGAFFIKGYEQFLVKGLRETIWDQKQNSYTKIRIMKYDSDPYIDSNLWIGSRIKIVDLRTFISYYMSLDPELIEQCSDVVKHIIKDSKIQPMTTSMREQFQKKETQLFLSIINIMYEINQPLLKLYSNNLLDLLVKSAILHCSDMSIDKYKPFENETGLSLIHKKVINEIEMLGYAIVHDVLFQVVTYTRKQRKRSSTSVALEKTVFIRKLLEPSSYVYEHMAINQFVSPVSAYCDASKLSIKGKDYCFNSKEVKDEFRDVHLSSLYNLCPISTSDKGNTGINLWLSESAVLDEHGRFQNLIDIEMKSIDDILSKGAEKLLSTMSMKLDPNNNNTTSGSSITSTVPVEIAESEHETLLSTDDNDNSNDMEITDEYTREELVS